MVDLWLLVLGLKGWRRALPRYVALQSNAKSHLPPQKKQKATRIGGKGGGVILNAFPSPNKPTAVVSSFMSCSYWGLAHLTLKGSASQAPYCFWRSRAHMRCRCVLSLQTLLVLGHPSANTPSPRRFKKLIEHTTLTSINLRNRMF